LPELLISLFAGAAEVLRAKVFIKDTFARIFLPSFFSSYYRKTFPKDYRQ
jgi:hypothetical protein